MYNISGRFNGLNPLLLRNAKAFRRQFMHKKTISFIFAAALCQFSSGWAADVVFDGGGSLNLLVERAMDAGKGMKLPPAKARPAAGVLPYAVNPSFGLPGKITVDGKNTGEWSDSNLIALGMANDDPRSLGSNWTMHELPVNLTHLWAAWDDDNLYLAWQYADVTDLIDPVNAPSAAGTKINQIDLPQWIALSVKPGEGSRYDMWKKNGGKPYWNGADFPDYQIYLASNLWQGYIGKAVNGAFKLAKPDYLSFKEAGIQAAVKNGLAAASLWGVKDADLAKDPKAMMDFVAAGHDAGRDSFYEIKIPLGDLGIDRRYLESTGIGVMLGQGEKSCMDTLPQDPATSNTPGVSESNSSLEWADNDLLTVNFARIGRPK